MTDATIVAVGLCDADLRRQAELAAEINCEHLACEKAASESLAHAMRAGDLLANRREAIESNPQSSADLSIAGALRMRGLTGHRIGARCG